MKNNRLTPSNLLLMMGLFVSQTFIIPKALSYSSLIRQQSYFLDILFYFCTIINILVFLSYLILHKFNKYAYIYEFILLPIITYIIMARSLTTDKFNQEFIQNVFKWCIFIIGLLGSVIMILNAYTRIYQQQTQNIVKISSNYRIIRLIKFLVFSILMTFNLLPNNQIIYFVIFAINLLNFWTFITNFTFQNPYHEYLIMIFSSISLVSTIDYLLEIYQIVSYSYVSQILIIFVLITQPQIIQRILQYKYRIFTEINTQSTELKSLIATFAVYKQIILKQNRSFSYSQDFEDRMNLCLHHMIIKYKLEQFITYEQQEKVQLKNQQLIFLILLQKRLKQFNQFIAYEFYLTLITRKTKFFNIKAVKVYYEKIFSKGQTNNNSTFTSNIFNRIQNQILYHNLCLNIQITQDKSDFHQILTFTTNLNILLGKLQQLCKFEVSFMNLLQNNGNSIRSNLNIFANKLIRRYDIKIQIKKLIDELNKSNWHIYSGNFLYICLIFKIIFSRQTQIIKQKILKIFIKPMQFQRKTKNEHFYDQKNLIIVLFSIKKQGLILNQNQGFSKTFNHTIRSSQKNKKYISQLFLSTEQRNYHQQLMQKSSQHDKQQQKSHDKLKCYIVKKSLISQQTNIQTLINSEQNNISIVQQVKITTRLYYQNQQEQTYICMIQKIIQDNQRIKVLSKQLQQLKKSDIQVEIINKIKINQLNQQFQICEIQLRDPNQSFYTSDSDSSVIQVNPSQRMNLDVKQQELQQNKIFKIQKQFDKQNSLFFNKQFRLFIYLIICVVPLIIIDSLYSMYQQNQYNSLLPLLNLEIFLFRNTIYAQKQIALSFIIYKMIKQNRINNDFCSKFGVLTLDKYIQTNSYAFASNRIGMIKQVSSQHLSKHTISLLNFQMRHNFDIKDTKIKMNYQKYLTLLTSSTFDGFSSLDTFQQNQKIWFQNYIKNAIKVDQLSSDSFYFLVRKTYQKQFNNLQELYSILLVLSIIFIIIIAVATILIFYKILQYNFGHVQLLNCFDQEFTQSRVRQMDFIVKQISNIHKNIIQDVQINKNLIMSYNIENKVKILDFSQFQQQTYNKIKHKYQQTQKQMSIVQFIEDQNQKLIEVQQTKQSGVISFIKILLSHKYIIIFIILTFLGLCALNLTQFSFMKQKINIDSKYQNALFQISKLIGSMFDVLLSEWLSFQNTQIYSTFTQNKYRASKAIQQLKKNQYKQIVYSLYPKKYIDTFFYMNYCRESMYFEQCESIKAGLLTNGQGAMPPFIVKDYQTLLLLIQSSNNESDKNKYYQQQICQKFVIFNNFTSQLYGKSLIKYSKVPIQDVQKSISDMKIIQILLIILLILIILFFSFNLIQTGIKYRKEILSMDSKKNLYEKYQTFRPFLNQLFYNEQSI